MSRLVDIEDVKNFINGLDSLPWEEEIDELLEIIPTAYDIEKVVAELEAELRTTRNAQTIECIKNDGYGTPLQAKNSGKIEMLLRAIDIVKRGGVE